MPELPEVETIRLSLLKKIDQAVIEEVVCYHPDVLMNVDHFNLKNWQIKGIRRRGKYLLFDLEQTESQEPMTMLVHLRMTGKLILHESLEDPAKHTHIRFLLAGGGCLDFNDVRRFGRVKLFHPGHESSDQGLASLGPEPLSENFTGDYLCKICKRFAKSSIKGLLLNQKAIAGLGNIYADESLFRAKIRPSRRAGQISQARLRLLAEVIKEVLTEAIGHRGTSFRDYVDGLGQKGFFQLQLAVYQKTGQPCPNCGRPIKRTKIAGRSTHFCPHCQT